MGYRGVLLTSFEIVMRRCRGSIFTGPADHRPITAGRRGGIESPFLSLPAIGTPNGLRGSGMSEAYDFLRQLWPEDNPHAHLVPCYGRGPRELKVFNYWTAAELDEMAEACEVQGREHNVWVNVCGLGGRPQGRGRESHVRFIPGVWAEVDKKYISDPVNALRRLGEWKPTMIVWSGNGAHAYWLYENGPIDLDAYLVGGTEDERRKLLREFQGRAKVQSARWIEWLKSQLGGKLDSVGDLARVLRVPGTNNVKDVDHPKPVRLVEVNGRFAPTSFGEVLERVRVTIPQDWEMTREQAAAAFARQGTLSDSETSNLMERWKPKLLHAVNTRKEDNSRDRSGWWWARQMNDLGVPQEDTLRAGWELIEQFEKTDSEGREDPLDENWWRAKVDSAYSYPPREPPKGASARGDDLAAKVAAELTNGDGDDGGDKPPQEPPGGEPPGGYGEWEPGDDNHADALSDAALRNWVVSRYGSRLKFCDALGFLVWDGSSWMPDGKEAPRVRHMYERAAEDYRATLLAGAQADEQVTNEIRRVSRAWLSNTRTKHVIEQAQQKVWVDFGSLNTHDHILNCPNGVVDLRTGELHAGDRDLLFTQRTTTPYVPWHDLPDEDRVRFIKFLSDATRSSAPFMNGLQRIAGYSLTGLTLEDKLFLVWGVKRSGKSTLVDGLLDVLGRGGFSEQVKPEILMSSFKARGNVDDAIAQASRARMIATFEPEYGEKFTEGLLKTATGGEALSARALYRSTYTFKPRWKIWVASNVKPGSMDPAVHDRLVILPFTRSVSGHEDRSLRPWVREPAAGGRVLLSWAVQGAVEYYQSGLRVEDIPEHIEALSIYRDEEDPVRAFAADWLELTPEKNDSILTRDAHFYYSMWCSQVGLRPLQSRAFGAAMEQHGHFKGRNGAGNMIFAGLRLKQASMDRISQLRYET